MKTLKILLAASFLAGVAGTISIPGTAIAHEGGAELDSMGCHHARSHRDYHCHEGVLEGMTFQSQGEAIRKYNRIRAQKEREDDGR